LTLGHLAECVRRLARDHTRARALSARRARHRAPCSDTLAPADDSSPDGSPTGGSLGDAPRRDEPFGEGLLGKAPSKPTRCRSTTTSHAGRPTTFVSEPSMRSTRNPPIPRTAEAPALSNPSPPRP